MSSGGYKSWGSLKKEVAYGTDPGGARDGWFRIVPPESIKVDKSYYESPGTGTRICRGVHEGVLIVGGDIEPETNFEGGWLHFLRAAFGLYAFTAGTDADGIVQAGVNRHSFQTTEDLTYSYSMEISRADTTANQVFLYKGVMVDAVEFGLQQDALLSAKFTVIAQDEAENTARVIAPVYPAELPIKNVYYNPSGAPATAVAVGSTITTLQSATIRMENRLVRRPNLAKLTAQPIPNDQRLCTAELMADFEDYTHYTKFKNETEGAFSLYLSGPILAGASRYKVKFDATTSHMTGSTPPIDSKGQLRIPIQLRFIKTDPEFKIVMGNNQTTL